MSRKAVLFYTVGCLAFLFLFAGACASGEVGEEAAECADNMDCPQGQFCNVVASTCETIPDPNNSNNSSDMGDPNNSNNPTNNSLEDMSADMVTPPDMNGEEDMGTVECNPACGEGQTCGPDGTCVEACSPSCQAPEVCTAQGCQIPDCRAAGDMCDLNRRDQGNFFCLPRSGQGRCLAKCDEPGAVSSCPTQAYCLNLGSSMTPLNVCLPSDCTDHADCSTGSCIRFDNDFGACFEAGPTPEGQACQVSSNGCETGTYCRRLAAGSNDGVCSTICDYFASTSDCPSGQACGIVFTSRTGLCSDDVSSSGSAVYDVCDAPSGSFCGDGLACIDFSTVDRCFAYCRPGENDCSVDTPAGNPSGCNNAVLPGEDALGLCEPQCDPMVANDCGVGAVCVDNGFGDFLCRLTCDPATVADDCCNGNTPCNFTCNSDNLCE